MNVYLYLVIPILILVILVLIPKVFLLKKSAKEIQLQIKEKTAEETNTLIEISSADKDMRSLAVTLNEELKNVNELRHKYSQGDEEIKKAVTNISHDLRTPLTAIFGYLDLLENEEKSENTEKYLSIIRNRTESMKNLTDELFSYSVVASSESELVHEKCDISALLQQSIADNYTLLSSRGIEPKISIPEQKIIRFSDKNAISRVFTNVISNAAKYSDGDLEITLFIDGEIRFTNSAENLSEIQVSKMFDRFYTVNEARNSTGLGLSIAKSLISQIGGEIKAEYDSKKLSIVVKV